MPTTARHRPLSSGHQPLSPVGHAGHDLNYEFGGGALTGNITASFDLGTSGVGGEKLAALKNTATTQLNGFSQELETALLGGELDITTLFPGVTVTFEANALNVSTDGAEVDADLLTIGVNIEGDVGDWLKTPGVGLSIKGNAELAIGGKLAARLAKVIGVQLQQRLLIDQMSSTAASVERRAIKIKELRSQLTSLEKSGGSDAAKKKLQAEILEQTRELDVDAKQLKKLAGEFDSTKRKAAQAIAKLEGKVLKGIGKAMHSKMMKRAVAHFAKLVPVLNVASAILDVVELIGIIQRIIDGENGSGGDDSSSAKETGGSSSSASANDSRTANDNMVVGKEGERGSGITTEDHAQAEEARRHLTPAARKILDALTIEGLRQGPALGRGGNRYAWCTHPE